MPDSNRHPGKMLPALARRAVESYSDPGDLVVDPMCGIGTTLIEASDLGRRAFGIELEARWATLATANLDHFHGAHEPARARAHVAKGDARELPRLLTVEGRAMLERRHGARAIASGAVDLVLTSPPYACEVADLNEVSGPNPLLGTAGRIPADVATPTRLWRSECGTDDGSGQGFRQRSSSDTRS